MKRFYIYSYIVTLLIIGYGPELRTVVERDKYNRIILEAELKGEVDTNWVKLHTYHFMGPSTDGPPLDETASTQTDMSVDDSGNLAWGAEEETVEANSEPTDLSEESTTDTSEAVQDFTITVDSTKKTFSSFVDNSTSMEKKR